MIAMPNVTNLEIFESREHTPVVGEPEPQMTSPTRPEPEGEVTGHYYFAKYVRCCFCGCVNYIKWDTDQKHSYICHNCGGYFDV